jgi:solute:Na+ symporter, SSS family
MTFMVTDWAIVAAYVGVQWWASWWRVNAWSEITAMIAPALGFLYLKLFTTIAFPYTLLYLVAWTTVYWLFVTMLTAPEPEAHLVAFYRRVRPGGPGWRAIARVAGGPPPEPIGGLVVDWLAGCGLVYAMLFGIGATVLGEHRMAFMCFAVAAAAIAVIWRDLSGRRWKIV